MLVTTNQLVSDALYDSLLLLKIFSEFLNPLNTSVVSELDTTFIEL